VKLPSILTREWLVKHHIHVAGQVGQVDVGKSIAHQLVKHLLLVTGRGADVGVQQVEVKRSIAHQFGERSFYVVGTGGDGGVQLRDRFVHVGVQLRDHRVILHVSPAGSQAEGNTPVSRKVNDHPRNAPRDDVVIADHYSGSGRANGAFCSADKRM
jgi:hypothetical protein